MQVEKTVFISYRRTNEFTARAIYQDLTANGYDAFLDFERIDAGAFEQVIMNQIAARAHFLIVLTPSALERCNEPGDMLRREIEQAIELERNVVPLLFEGFDFGKVSAYMTGKMTVLPQYNGLSVPQGYFDEAMTRLRERYLNTPLALVLQPTPPADESLVEQQQAAAEEHAPVTDEQLTADEYFERAFRHQEEGDYEGAIADYTEAIRLNPQHAAAYINRGVAQAAGGDLEAAILDYSEAIRFYPQFAEAFYNRGNGRKAKGDLEEAIEDYTEGLRINPKFAKAYNNRGNVHADMGDSERALADYTDALRIDPEYVDAYKNRGIEHYATGDSEAAIEDYTEALHLNSMDADVYTNRGVARSNNGDLNGAIEDYNEALRINPLDALAYSNRGEVYFEMKEYETARNDFKQAHELDPALPPALAGLGISKHALGEIARAKAYWTLLMGLDARYQDADWTGQELNWREPLIEEARTLVARL